MSLKIDYDNQPRKFLKNQDKSIIKRIMDMIKCLIKKQLSVPVFVLAFYYYTNSSIN